MGDENGKHRLIANFGGRESTEQRQPLRQQMAVALKLASCHGARPALLQQREGEEMTAKCRTQRLAKLVQFGELLGIGFRRHQPCAALAAAEQPAFGEDSDDALEFGRELIGLPVQEQFRPHQVADAAHGIEQPLRLDVAYVAEQAGEQRRQCEEVQYVVAEVAEQRHLGLGYAQQVTERMRDALDEAEPLDVLEHCLRRHVAGDPPGRIGGSGIDRLIVADHAYQRLAVGGEARCREQAERRQVDRVDDRRLVDARRQSQCSITGEVAQPGGVVAPAGTRIAGGLAPAGMVLVEEIRKVQGFTEIHMHTAEDALDVARRRQQLHQRFLAFRPAGKFADIGRPFHDALVADIDRHEDERPVVAADEARDGHAEDAGLGRQRASGAAAPALDEVLDRKAARQHQMQILVEDCGVERLPLETATQEEGTAAAQDGAEDRHVEVGAGSDVRRRHAVLVDQVGEQQVVDVAAMAGHIDDAEPGGDAQQCIEIVHFDAVVEMFPEPAQEELERTHDTVGIVGGDLHCKATRPRLCRGKRNLEPRCLGTDGGAHRIGAEDGLDLRVAVGKIGADGNLALAPEVHAQHARHLAQGHRLAERRRPAVHQFAQRERRIEANHDVATMQQDREELAQRTRRTPGFREQRPEDRLLLVGGPPPEDEHRNELNVAQRVGGHLANQAGKQRRHRVFQLVLPAQPADGKQRMASLHLSEGKCRLRWRQAGCRALLKENEHVGEVPVLEDVAHRPRRIDAGDGLGEDVGPDPGIEYPACQRHEPG